MASDAYWNATKPAGMPDYVWQQQQAAQKAAQTAAAAATAAVAKKAAEEAAKKTSSSSNKGTYNTAKSTVANTNPTSYNTAQYYAAQALQNAGQTVPKPDTGTTTDIVWDMISSKPLSQYNTADIEAAKGYDRIIESESKQNTSSNKTTNGLTTEDAKKEHITVMNDPTMNIPTDGEITLGWVADNGKGSGGSGSGSSSVKPSTPAANNPVTPDLNPNPNPTPTPSGGGGVVIYPSGGGGGGSVPTAPGSGYYDGANWSGGMSYKPYPTAEDMAGYVSTIIQAAKKELGDVISPEYMDAKAPDAPELRTLEDLANTFGITYDYDSIYKILNDSVEKQYDAIYQRQKQNEDKYYDNAAAAQNTLLDTLSRDRSNAVSAGVSKGMQAANALGAMLGVSQQFANNATALSQERSNTAKDYGASLAKAVVDAEATSNERKNAIMEISKMLYGYDSEQYVANMDNYSTILTNNAALQQAYMNNHTSLQNALASIFGGVANNKIMGDANVQSSTLAAEAQKAAAQYAAAAQQYAAQQSYLSNQAIADANRDAANISANTQALTALLQAGLLDANEVKNATGGSSTGTGTSSSSPSTAQNWLDLLAKVAYNTQSGSTNNMYYK